MEKLSQFFGFLPPFIRDRYNFPLKESLTPGQVLSLAKQTETQFLRFTGTDPNTHVIREIARATGLKEEELHRWSVLPRAIVQTSHLLDQLLDVPSNDHIIGNVYTCLEPRKITGRQLLYFPETSVIRSDVHIPGNYFSLSMSPEAIIFESLILPIKVVILAQPIHMLDDPLAFLSSIEGNEDGRLDERVTFSIKQLPNTLMVSITVDQVISYDVWYEKLSVPALMFGRQREVYVKRKGPPPGEQVRDIDKMQMHQMQGQGA